MPAVPPIFINYREADTAVEARLLFADLANHFGREAVFLDKKYLHGGMAWPDELTRKVKGAKILLVLLKDGKKWMGLKDNCTFRICDPEDWVRLEIETAKAEGKLIVPVLLDGADFPAESVLPESLRFLRSTQCRKITTQEWDAGTAELIKLIEKHVSLRAVAASAKVDALDGLPLPEDVPDPLEHHSAPFLGLRYFDRNAARLFFGRRREILEFFSLVDNPDVRLICLFGHSGAGKSSLLAAGVLPRLEVSYSPFYERRRITERPTGIAGQLDRLRRQPKTPDKPPVYILDQVEEMFTDPLPGEPDAFVESLRKTVREEPEATVVLGFRSDFQMDVMGLLRHVDCRREDLPIYPLTQNALAEAIEGVANDPILSKRYQLELEKGFAEHVARDIVSRESSSSAATILQNRLLKLYQNAAPISGKRRLTVADYQNLARSATAEAELLADQLQRLREEHHLKDDRILLETLHQFVVDKPTAGTLPKNRLPDDPQQIRTALLRVNLLTELPESQAIRLSHDLLAPVIREQYRQFLLSETDRLETENIRLWLAQAKEKIDNIEFEAAFDVFKSASSSRKLLPDEVGATAFELAFVFLFAEKHEQGSAALRDYCDQMASTDKIFPDPPGEGSTCSDLLDYLRRCDPVLFKTLEKKYFPTMIRVEGGEFDMGDVLGDGGFNVKLHVHRVRLSTYSLAETPTTWYQYGVFCLEKGLEVPDDRGWGRADRPVIHVSWEDAAAYAKWLAKKTGEPYRLPTEAEWEFAARERGKPLRFGNGKMIADPAEMNFNAREEYRTDYSVAGEYRGKTTPVRQFSPNALGLYDMSGNVWEWCRDWYAPEYYKECAAKGVVDNPLGPSEGSYRVYRGGG